MMTRKKTICRLVDVLDEAEAYAKERLRVNCVTREEEDEQDEQEEEDEKRRRAEGRLIN
jgi:hypothetical protein